MQIGRQRRSTAIESTPEVPSALPDTRREQRTGPQVYNIYSTKIFTLLQISIWTHGKLPYEFSLLPFPFRTLLLRANYKLVPWRIIPWSIGQSISIYIET